MKYVLYAHNQYSNGARALARGLGIRRIRHQDSQFRGDPGNTLLINWGSSVLPPALGNSDGILNLPDQVGLVTNKLAFFQHESTNEMVTTDYLPGWTDSKETAIRYMRRYPEQKIVCRTVLNGHSGAGIVIASTPEELVDAPLYVRYIKKMAEYRVHIMDGNVFDVQQKLRKHDFPEEQVNHQVRSHKNGWVYARTDVDAPQAVLNAALRIFRHFGLHFGAVDVIWNKANERAYVLEINTAPGLEGETVTKYVQAFRLYYGINPVIRRPARNIQGGIPVPQWRRIGGLVLRG